MGLVFGSFGTSVIAYRIYRTFFRVSPADDTTTKENLLLCDEDNTEYDSERDSYEEDETADVVRDLVSSSTSKNPNKKQLVSSLGTSSSNSGSSGSTPSNPRTSYRSSMFGITTFATDSRTSSSSLLVEEDNIASFFTNIMSELWSYVKIAGANKIKAVVEPKFRSMPSPMNTCRFTTIELGDTPLQMENIVVHKHPQQHQQQHSITNTAAAPSDHVKWEFDFIWDGDCNIELQADYIGKFGVKELKVKGRLSIVMKPLMGAIPVVSCIQYCFINMPEIDLNFTGFGSRITQLSFIKSSVKSAIQSSLASYCLPNRSIYQVSSNYPKGGPSQLFYDTYTKPLGILRLWIESGKGFVIERRLLASDDIPDVYCNITMGADSSSNTIIDTNSVWKTPTIPNDCNPVWLSSDGEVLGIVRDFLVWDFQQQITIHAWDEDDLPFDPDDDLGSVTISVQDLLVPSSSSSSTATNNAQKTFSTKRATTTTICNDDNADGKHRKELPLRYEGRKTGSSISVACQFGEWAIKHGSTPSLDRITTKSSTVMNGMLIVLVSRVLNLTAVQNQKLKLKAMFVRMIFRGKTYDASPIVNSNGDDGDSNSAYCGEFNAPFESSFCIPLVDEMNVDSNDECCVSLELINGGTVAAATSPTLPPQSSSSLSPKSPSSDSKNTNNNNLDVIGRTAITFGEVRNTNHNGSININKTTSTDCYTWTGKRRLDGAQICSGSLEFQILLSDRVVLQEKGEKKKKTATTTMEIIPKKECIKKVVPGTAALLRSSSSPLNKKNKNSSSSLHVMNERKNAAAVPSSSTKSKTTAILSSVVGKGRDSGKCVHVIKNDEIAENIKTTTVRLRVVSVRGLKAKQQLWSVDIPSVYCVLKIIDSESSSSYSIYQTSTKYNTINPCWYTSNELSNNKDVGECKDFTFCNNDCMDNNNIAVHCEVWDTQYKNGMFSSVTVATRKADTSSNVLLLGRTTTSLQKLMSHCNISSSSTCSNDADNTTIELELNKNNEQQSGIFLTLHCTTCARMND